MLGISELFAARFRLCGVVFLIDGLRAVGDIFVSFLDDAAQFLDFRIDFLDAVMEGAQFLDGLDLFRVLRELLLLCFLFSPGQIRESGYFSLVR